MAVFSLILTQVKAQDNTVGKWSQISKAGYAFTGTGDLHFMQLELGANYAILPKLSAEATIGLGKSFEGAIKAASFTKTNLNAFYLLTHPEKKYNFSLGAGISYMGLNTTSGYYNNEGYFYQYNSTNHIGLNLTIRNNWNFNDRFGLGLDINYQNYQDHGSFVGGVIAAQIKI